jgi:hypothetical protein
MLTLDFIQEYISKLNLPIDNYVLFGSLPMLAYGLIQQVNDIDILANHKAWGYAKTLAPTSLSAKGLAVIQLGEIEIYNEWMDMDIDSIIARAVFIEGLPYAKLEDVLHYKQMLNRPKDQEHIRLIQGYLEQKQ